MFTSAVNFDQNIESWNLSSLKYTPHIVFTGADAMLANGWSSSPNISDFKGSTINGSSAADIMNGGDGNDFYQV